MERTLTYVTHFGKYYRYGTKLRYNPTEEGEEMHQFGQFSAFT